MLECKGDYFVDKKEVIEYYKIYEKNFEDKFDWLIECIIDFVIQYFNYKEYCEVEVCVKNGQELIQKQKKKYGSFKWDCDIEDYKDGQVFFDMVEVKELGVFDDLIDFEVWEKYNKYDLDFGKQLELLEDLVFCKKVFDGIEYEVCVKVVDVVGKLLEREDWDICELNKVGELDLDDLW